MTSLQYSATCSSDSYRVVQAIWESKLDVVLPVNLDTVPQPGADEPINSKKIPKSLDKDSLKDTSKS
jgi:hypothetical protein